MYHKMGFFFFFFFFETLNKKYSLQPLKFHGFHHFKRELYKQNCKKMCRIKPNEEIV